MYKLFLIGLSHLRCSFLLLTILFVGCAQEPLTESKSKNQEAVVDNQFIAKGRFVPEREDDFAWENNKVAFRVYGPASSAQGPASGVDAWFKKVDYPVIDKWYAEHLQGKSYHEDHGEGYDVFHTGTSRGVGGTAVWLDGVAYPAGPFSSYKVLANGPDEVVFRLRYEWETPLGSITEDKTVSLVVNSQLYQVDSIFSVNGEPAVLPIAIGLTTHDESAEVFKDEDTGRISTWEVIDGYGVGTGVINASGSVADVVHHVGNKKDESHIWLITSSDEVGRLSYSAGFVWQAAKVISSINDWNKYLDDLSN